MTPLRVVRRVPNVKMLLVRDRNFEICNAAASTEFLGLLDFMTAVVVLKLFPQRSALLNGRRAFTKLLVFKVTKLE